MSGGPLEDFLAEEMRVDGRIVAAMTDLGFETVDDFAHFWTGEEYEEGLRELVAGTPAFGDLGRPAARLQVARLRRAWEMKRLGRPPGPAEVGYGVLSDALDCSYAALALALEAAAAEPWRIHDVEEAACELRWRAEERALERRLKGAAGGAAGDAVFPREDLGELVFRAAEGAPEGAFWRGLPRDAEAVLRLQPRPLRLELFARGADGLRLDWRGVAHDEACEALGAIVRLAREAEGAALAALEGAPPAPEALWRAMHPPAPGGAHGGAPALASAR